MAESNGTTSKVPLEEVQGNVTPGFRKDYQTFLFLRFPQDPDAVQTWLRGLYPCIASALQVATYNREYRTIKERFGDNGMQVSRFWRSTWVNLAFTAKGLKVLDPEAVAAALDADADDAFANGMCKRIRALNESPADLANWWVRDSIHGDESGDRAALEQKVAHALLLVGSDTAHDLGLEVSNQLAFATRHGLSLISLMQGQTLGGGRDHFGFRDGISQPDPEDPLEGWTWRDPEDPDDGWPIQGSEQIAPPGLIIRGCETFRPDQAGEAIRDPFEWEQHGSYLVFRRFRQDMSAFKEKVRVEAERLRTRPGFQPMNENLLMAQLVGRWPSGAKLVRPDGPDDEVAARDPCPDAAAKGSRATLTRDDYYDDRSGRVCPVSAHVRASFPRIVRGAKLHRMVRRGIPYSDENGEKGLLFVAYQARIEDGFQFIQATWLSSSLSPETNEVMPRPPAPVAEAAEPDAPPADAAVVDDPVGGVPAGAAPAVPAPVAPVHDEVPAPANHGDNVLRVEEKGLDAFTAVAEAVEIPRPINGVHAPVGAVGAQPAPVHELVKLPRLITIEGGGYFFSPSISRIKRLAGVL